MGTAWKSGWIPMLDERKPERGTFLHRPFPDFPGYTLCGMSVADPSVLSRRKPTGLPECPACARFMSDSCAQAKRSAERTAERVDPGGIDRRDRAAQRGTSIRSVSAGLPTLGKRHR